MIMRVSCPVPALAILLIPLYFGDAYGAYLNPTVTTARRPLSRLTTSTTATTTWIPLSSAPLFAAAEASTKEQKPRKKYEPKWKKKQTLNEQLYGGAPPSLEQVGIKGDVPVVFRQGNATRTTMAMRGQPLRDVASQAGQFIKYGCGKGECGTCEALVQGKWVRPCIALIPADAASGEEYVIVVKEGKSKSASSGKFFSVRSFFMGFWNNLLGMVGFVRGGKQAKRSWNERREYEELIKLKTLEKKRAREQQQQSLKP